MEISEEGWSLSGNVGASEIAEILEYPEPILSEYGAHRVTLEQSQHGFETVTINMWLPDQRPMGVSEVIMEAGEQGEKADFRIVTQEMTVQNRVDSQGIIEESWAGSLFGTIATRRIFHAGSPAMPEHADTDTSTGE